MPKIWEKKARALAKRLGAHVEASWFGRLMVTAFAPEGMQWADGADALFCVAEEADEDDETPWRDLYYGMDDGLVRREPASC